MPALRPQSASALITGSSVRPFFVRVVVEDDGLTLMDTGLGGTRRLILARAATLGMPIVRIAITHAHRDHCGSLDALAAALPGVQVIASEREAPLLAGDGEPRDHASAGPLPGDSRAVGIRPSRLVADGDAIGSLRVLATPGHTPGHLAFLDTRDAPCTPGTPSPPLAGWRPAPWCPGGTRWPGPRPGTAASTSKAPAGSATWIRSAWLPATARSWGHLVRP